MSELATRTPVELELPVSARELAEASASENTRRAYTGALARRVSRLMMLGSPPTSPACSSPVAPPLPPR